jgi:hypothetical protein
MAESDLVRLIIDVKESLEREFGALRQEVHERFAQLNARFDQQAARLDRLEKDWQTGPWTTGRRR